jgi:hypothetical protein
VLKLKKVDFTIKFKDFLVRRAKEEGKEIQENLVYK